MAIAMCVVSVALFFSAGYAVSHDTHVESLYVYGTGVLSATGAEKLLLTNANFEP